MNCRNIVHQAHFGTTGISLFWLCAFISRLLLITKRNRNDKRRANDNVYEIV